MFVHRRMANPTQQHPGDVLIPMGTVTQTQKMHSQTNRSSGPTKMVMDLETMFSSQMATSASMFMVKAQRTVSKDVQIRI